MLDLVFAPGGIASLGASRSTELTATLIVCGFCPASWTVLAGRNVLHRPFARLIKTSAVVSLVVVLGIGERVGYGFNHAANFQPILFASEQYPLYLPLTFRKLAAKLGISSEKLAEGPTSSRLTSATPSTPWSSSPPPNP